VFEETDTALAVLGGTEMIHMLRKGQAKYAWSSQLSLSGQFDILAA
jgi:putative transposase